MHDEATGGSTAEAWDALYRERPQIWSGKVNPLLAEEAARLTPGTALDLGCGEGADAIWLARQGWAVTGTDISTLALERAAAHARDAGVAERIRWVAGDLADGVPPGPFDLVSAQFLQSFVEFARADVLRAAAGAVGPGGSLLVVGHAAAPTWSRHHHDGDFPTPESELADLGPAVEGWDVRRAEVADREATGPDGEAGTLLDCVLLVTRPAA